MISNGDFVVYSMSNCVESILVTNADKLLALDSTGQEVPFSLHQKIAAKSYQTIEIVAKGTTRWQEVRGIFEGEFNDWKRQVTAELKAAEEALELYK